MKPALVLCASLLLLSQCTSDVAGPEGQLPPITQSGATTFDCLVNGLPWTPRGNYGTANYSVYYAAAYAQGTLNISTYRYANSSSDSKQLIVIYLFG